MLVLLLIDSGMNDPDVQPVVDGQVRRVHHQIEAISSWVHTSPIFPWGDLSSRCTRGNGVLDTEDLNGDGVLDAAGPNENVFRYVVNLANNDFFVRNGVPTRDAQGNVIAVWKLYRIPIRTPDATIGTPYSVTFS